MYESFFDLSSRPFPAAPAVEYYFPTPNVEQARQTLIRIVDRAEGPGLIIGQPGLGKTLLLRMLDHHFQNVFHCIHLASAAIESRKDLLQNVLFELDLPYRNMEEGELRLSLLDFLRPSESCPNGVLLLVDEAHTLPLQLLDEIRMITNLVRDGQPRVRLVLAGDAQLDDVFADPRLDSFNQRIAARCYLEPLNQEQTIEYVQAQIATIGGEPAGIFTHDALVAVYRASGGIPRLINQVCDHSLVMASLGGYHQLDAAGIEEAWADLQQLPGPWNEPARTSEQSDESILEFGTLDDDDAPNTDIANTEIANAEVGTAQADVGTPLADDLNAATFEVGATAEFAADQTSVDLFTTSDAPDAEVNAVRQHAPFQEATFEQTTYQQIAGTEFEAESLPDPANETPVAAATPGGAAENEQTDPSGSNLPESELPGPDPFVKLEPQGNSQPDVLLNELQSNHLSSNVVQAEWEDEADAVTLPTYAPCDAGEKNSVAAESTAAETAPPVKLASAQPVPTVSAATTNEPNADVVDPFGHGFEEEEIVVDRYADQSGGVFAGCPQVSSEEGRELAALLGQDLSPQLSVVDPDAVAGDNVDSLAETDDGSQVEAIASSEANSATESAEPAEQTDDVADEVETATHELVAAAELTAQSLANNVFDTASLSDWLFSATTETVGAAQTLELDSSGDDDVPNEPIDEPATETAELEIEDIQPVADIQPVIRPSSDPPQIVAPPTPEATGPSFLQMHEGLQANDDRDMIIIDEDKNDGVILTQTSDDLARRVEYQQLFSQLRDG